MLNDSNDGTTQSPTIDFTGELAVVGDMFRQHGTAQSLLEGDVLFEEGSSGRDVYLLVSGTVAVDSGNECLAALSGPDVVGEFAFIDNRPRSATIRALTEAHFLRLDRETLLQSIGTKIEVLNQFLETLSQRMQQRLSSPPPLAQQEAPGPFLERLTAEALGHRAVHHPYLLALANGDLPDTRRALADFGRQYLGYSAHFPRYLATVIGRLTVPAHREALMENLMEESGHYCDDDLAILQESGIQAEWIVDAPHPLLFRRFCTAVDGRPGNVVDDSIEVLCWRDMLLNVLRNGTPAEAIGALGPGTETIISTMYTYFLPALERAGVSSRDGVFFPLHTMVDDHHQAALLEIASHYAQTVNGRHELEKGMHKALFLRLGFWDWMYARAQAMTPEEIQI